MVCTQPKFGNLDRRGLLVISPKFQWAQDFSEGLAAVQLNDLWGYITPTGQFAIAASFQSAETFSGGTARVEIDGRSAFIDHAGREIVP